MLLDTSGLLCCFDANEVRHDEAVKHYGDASLRLTHNYVLAEFVALAQARGLPREASLTFSEQSPEFSPKEANAGASIGSRGEHLASLAAVAFLFDDASGISRVSSTRNYCVHVVHRIRGQHSSSVGAV